MRGQRMRYAGSPLGIRPDWQIQKVLGRGGEGVIYLVADADADRKFVAKVFHLPRPKQECRSLQTYADRVMGEYPGLPKLELLEDQDSIHGIAYQYRPLHEVHYRLWDSVDQLAQALVGSYCRMQSHLISTASIAICDPYIRNFLLAPDGRFHWVDFGWGISTIDHPRNLDYGRFGYGCAGFLLSIYGIEIKPAVILTPGYSHAQPCRYCMDPRLDALAARHSWLHQVLDDVRHQPAAAFLEAEFYRRLGAQLPDRVTAPGAVIVASELLRTGGRSWSLLRHMIRAVRSTPEPAPKE